MNHNTPRNAQDAPRRAEQAQIGFNGTCVEITALPSQGRMLVYKCSHWELVPDMCQAGLLKRSQADPACNGHVDVYLPS